MIIPCRETIDDRVLLPRGWRQDAWYGVRVFSDHRDEDAPPAEELPTLLAAEREAGRGDPYRRVAALLHVVYAPSLTTTAPKSHDTSARLGHTSRGRMVT